MSLQVIGAGLGRTGTLSLKLALEKLGFSKCHHMVEVFEHPGQASVFYDAARGKPVDWDGLFEGYRASVDWPSCHFWRQLAEYYPDAKVILSYRDPESWYKSISDTIFATIQGLKTTADPDQPMRRLVEEIVENQTFSGRIDDRETVIQAYLDHCRSVRESLPPERLLEFQAREGWEPLCRFLNVDVPDEPYPRTNSTSEFVGGHLIKSAEGQTP